MDGFRPGNLGSRDDPRDVEIALSGRGFSDTDVLVREPDVQRLSISLGIDGDRLHPQLVAGADDAESDFPAIGDQDLLKQVFISWIA